MITFSEATLATDLGNLKAAIIGAVPGFTAHTSAEGNEQAVRAFAAAQTTGTKKVAVLDYQKQIAFPFNPVNDTFHVKVRFLYVDGVSDVPDNVDADMIFTRASLTTP